MNTNKMALICSECGQVFGPDEKAFGSPETGWKHPFSCPEKDKLVELISSAECLKYAGHGCFHPECQAAALRANRDYVLQELGGKQHIGRDTLCLTHGGHQTNDWCTPNCKIIVVEDWRFEVKDPYK